MNGSWHTWMSHGTHVWVMAHTNESWHTCMSHGTHEWVMAHRNRSWHREWVMAYVNESFTTSVCHIVMAHMAHMAHMARTNQAWVFRIVWTFQNLHMLHELTRAWRYLIFPDWNVCACKCACMCYVCGWKYTISWGCSINIFRCVTRILHRCHTGGVFGLAPPCRAVW